MALNSCKRGYELAKDDDEKAAALLNYGIAQRRGYGTAGVPTAVEAWRRAAELDPSAVPPRRYLAVVAAQAGLLREAAEAEKQAFLLAPRPESLLHFTELALAFNGSTAERVGADLLRSGFGDPASLDGFQDALTGYAASARAEGASASSIAALRQAAFLYADFQKDWPGAWTALTEANAERRRAADPELLERNGAASSTAAAAAVIKAFPGVAEARERRDRRKAADDALLAEVARPARESTAGPAKFPPEVFRIPNASRRQRDVWVPRRSRARRRRRPRARTRPKRPRPRRGPRP